jgi:hypothetical protein
MLTRYFENRNMKCDSDQRTYSRFANEQFTAFALMSHCPIINVEPFCSYKDSIADFHITTTDLQRGNDEWDSFVKSLPGGDIVQTSVWGLSKRSIGQRPVLIIMRDRDHSIAGGMLVIERQVGSWLRMGYIARGPLYRKDNRAILPAALAAAKIHMRRRGLFGLVVQLAEGGEVYNSVLEGAAFARGTFSVVPEATIRIDVRQSDEQILGSMSSMRRRNVLKSVKHGFDLVHSEDVATFHRLHLSTGTRKEFSALTFQYLDAQWGALSTSGHVTILQANFGGQAMAALWLSKFGNVVTFRLGGWDRDVKGPSHVNEALHWKAIQWARSINASFYDFGGFDRGNAERLLKGQPVDSSLKSHNLFKLGFGGTPILFPPTYFLLTSRPLNWLASWVGPPLLKMKQVRKLAHKLRS